MNDRNSIRAVNILFLIVLILQASNMLFLWVPQYVRLTINQALFVFLPAYLYLRLVRKPVLPTVRWRWPGWRTGLLALLLGAGLYPISAASAAVLQQILGYSIFELPADTIPTTLGMGLLAIIAYAIMAPICEEFLFRGVIQPVYERRRPRFAILFVGLLFIVFHLSLLQGLSIVLLSLALGFVNNRTRSLQASIFTHFGANMLAALVLTQSVFPTGIASVLFSAPGILAGIGLALVAFLRLLRLPQPEAVAQPELLPAQEPASPGRSGMRSALAAWWPLLVGGFLYLIIVSAEVIFSRSPELSAPPLEAAPLNLTGEQTRYYDLYNVADELVGEGECRLAASDELVELSCTSIVRDYEVRQDNSIWSSVHGERRDEATWRAEDGRLFSGSSVFTAFEMDYRWETAWRFDEDGIWAEFKDTNMVDTYFLDWGETPQTGEHDLLVVTDYSAPWQISGVDFEVGVMGRVVRFHPYTWRPETQDSGPDVQVWLISTAGMEAISLVERELNAWKVRLGPTRLGWYEENGVTGPVKFFNGMETWVEK